MTTMELATVITNKKEYFKYRPEKLPIDKEAYGWNMPYTVSVVEQTCNYLELSPKQQEDYWEKTIETLNLPTSASWSWIKKYPYG